MDMQPTGDNMDAEATTLIGSVMDAHMVDMVVEVLLAGRPALSGPLYPIMGNLGHLVRSMELGVGILALMADILVVVGLLVLVLVLGVLMEGHLALTLVPSAFTTQAVVPRLEGGVFTLAMTAPTITLHNKRVASSRMMLKKP
jgi:hypothetical protein